MKIIRIKHTKLFPQGYKAITIGPFVFTKKNTKLNVVDINHEAIHWEQEKEMLIIFFLLWYVIEFFIRLFTSFNWSNSYHNISFEKECYINEENLKYIDTRKHYSWLKYVRKS